jgi:Tol biopolymer transport system component
MKYILPLLLAATMVVLSCKSDTTAPDNGTGPRIFYNTWSTSTADHVGPLMAVHADLKGLTQLSATAFLCSRPSSNAMIVLDKDAMNMPVVQLMALSGAVQQTLASPAAYTLSRGTLAANGSRLALFGYDATQSTGGLYVVNSDGTAGSVLKTDVQYEMVPGISDDGTRIGYLGADHKFRVVNNDGTGLKVVNDTNSYYTGRFNTAPPQFKSTGDMVLYTGAYLGTPRLIQATIAGGVSAVYSGVGSDGVWSPDGTKIAFSSAGRIATVPNDFRTAATILTTPSGAYDYAPQWSPDGTKLLYVSRPGAAPGVGPMTLNVLEIATGTITKIADSVVGPGYWER